jgi:hypothetical protein
MPTLPSFDPPLMPERLDETRDEISAETYAVAGKFHQDCVATTTSTII